MSDPRVVGEVEIPDPRVQALRPPPQPRPQPQGAPSLARLYALLARMVGARMQSHSFVIAMIWLSYLAVDDPTPHRLIAAGGFNLFALVGIWLVYRHEGGE